MNISNKDQGGKTCLKIHTAVTTCSLFRARYQCVSVCVSHRPWTWACGMCWEQGKTLGCHSNCPRPGGTQTLSEDEARASKNRRTGGDILGINKLYQEGQQGEGKDISREKEMKNGRKLYKMWMFINELIGVPFWSYTPSFVVMSRTS